MLTGSRFRFLNYDQSDHRVNSTAFIIRHYERCVIKSLRSYVTTSMVNNITIAAGFLSVCVFIFMDVAILVSLQLSCQLTGSRFLVKNHDQSDHHGNSMNRIVLNSLHIYIHVLS